MAISSAVATSFKRELLDALHDLDTDTFKIALYTSAANLGAATTAYTTTSEVVGTGYTAGGQTLTTPAVTISGTTVIIDFADPSWPAATITARGALIYNSSKANRAVAVYDFGSDKASTQGTFTVILPAADATNALIRLT